MASLKHKKILITSGPTSIPIDNVRILSNKSTGELGQILANQLTRQGARVTLLEGPVLKPRPLNNVNVKKFFYYDQLNTLIKKKLKQNYAAVVHAAAVGDYQLKKIYKHKIRSNLKKLQLTFVPTPKIINQIKHWNRHVFLVGFKLEPNFSDLKKSTKKLFTDADCDLVVANSNTPGYRACILDSKQHILAQADSKTNLSKKLIKVLTERL